MPVGWRRGCIALRGAQEIDISDGICAYLTGGLGNQLFVYAAAWAQAVRLGCPLYVDASAYRAEEERRFELGDLDLRGRLLRDESPWRLRHPARSRGWKSIKSTKLSVFHEEAFGFDNRINNVGVGTTLVGYYQSPRYFHGIEADLRATLQAIRPSAMLWPAQGSLHIHVRRGDYMNPKTMAFHGVASPDYFARAMALQVKLGASMRPRVFTDSLELVEGELSQLGSLEFYQDLPTSTPLQSLLTMSHASRFILSNSSFSWWAAWLSDITEVVIAPRPWLASGESASDLLLPNWLTLDGR